MSLQQIFIESSSPIIASGLNRKETIFVHIASFRDEELPLTIKYCLENAAHPERLHFGICHQYDEHTHTMIDHYFKKCICAQTTPTCLCDFNIANNHVSPRHDEKKIPSNVVKRDNLSLYKSNHFKIVEIPWQNSKGVGYARNICNQLYEDEDFFLQIDSHMRFTKNWDVVVIEEWNKAKNIASSDMVLLTEYPAAYKYIKCTPNQFINKDNKDNKDNEDNEDNKENREAKEVYQERRDEHSQRVLVVNKLEYGFVPVFKAAHVSPTSLVPGGDKIIPQRTRFTAAGFLFGPGGACKIEYEPDVCFIGEEILLSYRLYCAGYKLYAPTIPIVWHLYERRSVRFWDVQKNYNEMFALSLSTLKARLLCDAPVIGIPEATIKTTNKSKIETKINENENENENENKNGNKNGKEKEKEKEKEKSKYIVAFENFSGVNFLTGKVHSCAITGEFLDAKNDQLPHEWIHGDTYKKKNIYFELSEINTRDILNSAVNTYHQTQSVSSQSCLSSPSCFSATLPCPTYLEFDFWYVGFISEMGKEIFRHDYRYNQPVTTLPDINTIATDAEESLSKDQNSHNWTNFKKIVIDDNAWILYPPSKVIIWPHCLNIGWLSQKEYLLNSPKDCIFKCF